jgi:hypothetical protein
MKRDEQDWNGEEKFMRTTYKKVATKPFEDRPYSILIVNDLHVGSQFGLLSPAFIDSEDVPQPQNPAQEVMWGEWNRMVNSNVNNPPNMVVVLGDSMDGKQRKSDGSTLCVKPADQPEAAYEVLRVIQRAFPAASWEWVVGTGYHELKENVEALVQKMNVERPNIHRHFKLDVHGTIIEFNHEISSASGNALHREIDRAHVARSKHGIELPNLIVRGHYHVDREMRDGNVRAVVSPCWQLQTEFMCRKSTTAMIPDLGSLWITVDPARKARGLDPVQLDVFRANAPAESIMVATEVAVIKKNGEREERIRLWRPSVAAFPRLLPSRPAVTFKPSSVPSPQITKRRPVRVERDARGGVKIS